MASEPDAALLIREFTASISPDFAQRVSLLLRAHTNVAEITRARVMREVPNSNACERISSFIETLSVIRPKMLPEVLAFGIDCALETLTHESNLQRIDLVWTGPETSVVSLRRSAAVLLELIAGTQDNLIMMSFASFRIPDVEAALSEAINRGVHLYLILESEEDSSGRYHQYGTAAFNALPKTGHVALYSWPKHRRPRGAVLHAKAVICDANKALITSANLTERAIDENIELGIRIEGGNLPQQLHSHVMSLIDAGEFEVQS